MGQRRKRRSGVIGGEPAVDADRLVGLAGHIEIVGEFERLSDRHRARVAGLDASNHARGAERQQRLRTDRASSFTRVSATLHHRVHPPADLVLIGRNANCPLTREVQTEETDQAAGRPLLGHAPTERVLSPV